MSAGGCKLADFAAGQLCHMDSNQVRGNQSEILQSLQRPFPGQFHRGINFTGCFMDVHVYANVEFIGEHANMLQRFIRDSVGCVGGKHGLDQRVSTVVIVNSEAL